MNPVCKYCGLAHQNKAGAKVCCLDKRLDAILEEQQVQKAKLTEITYAVIYLFIFCMALLLVGFMIAR